MKKQFVTKEIAVYLKELGFDEPCVACYCYGDLIFRTNNHLDGTFFTNNDLIEYEYLAPLWQQVEDWFRVKHDINIHVGDNRLEYDTYDGKRYYARVVSEDGFYDTDNFDTSQEAREKAILEAIETIKEKRIKNVNVSTEFNSNSCLSMPPHSYLNCPSFNSTFPPPCDMRNKYTGNYCKHCPK